MYFGTRMTRVDIILPVYNPLPGWEEIVIQHFESIQHMLGSWSFHLIVVNDCSTKMDEVHAVPKLKKAIKKLTWVSYEENRGKGYALRKGIARAEGDLIIYTDIDWPYSKESMIRLIHRLDDKSDVVIGTRDWHYYQKLPKTRRWISKSLRYFKTKLLRLRVNDTQAGLKGFRKAVKPVFLSTTINRYLFDLEFIYLLSSKKDLQVTALPIELREGITFSKMNRKILFQEAWNFLKIWLK